MLNSGFSAASQPFTQAASFLSLRWHGGVPPSANLQRPVLAVAVGMVIASQRRDAALVPAGDLQPLTSYFTLCVRVAQLLLCLGHSGLQACLAIGALGRWAAQQRADDAHLSSYWFG